MASNLQRKSTGLQPGHRGLIRLLAEIAVQQYLDELEAAETTGDGEMQQMDCEMKPLQAARRAT